jgi:N-6 DNA Methylase/HsdM N-terminal domain
VALKKSDLYGYLWKSCDELRGGMDASQYKDYILTLLFVKYVSDKAKASKQRMIDVPAGASFDDMKALKGNKEIGDKINKIIAKLAEANGLEKVIDLADFNDEEKLGKGKEMQDRLSNLVAIFEGMDFRGSKAEGDDLRGDAYEYLMRHFATESGKSKGQFYTPAEVSRVMAKLLQIPPTAKHSTTVYDPACGSGSLLINRERYNPVPGARVSVCARKPERAFCQWPSCRPRRWPDLHLAPGLVGRSLRRSCPKPLWCIRSGLVTTYNDRSHRRFGRHSFSRRNDAPAMRVSSSRPRASSGISGGASFGVSPFGAAPASAGVAAAWSRRWEACGVARSKNRSSSTGNGSIRVLFSSAATSTSVSKSRSWNAAGCSLIT